MFLRMINRFRTMIEERQFSYQEYYNSLSVAEKAREDNLLLAISFGVGII